jgi:hypothetical protein
MFRGMEWMSGSNPRIPIFRSVVKPKFAEAAYAYFERAFDVLYLTGFRE